MKNLVSVLMLSLFLSLILTGCTFADTRGYVVVDDDARSIVVLLLGTLVWPECASAKTRPTGPRMRVNNHNPADDDTRAIYGIGSLDLGDLLSDPKQTWVVADILPGRRQEPGPFSPVLASGGGFADRERNAFLKEMFGKVKITSTLAGKSPVGTEDYDWTSNGISITPPVIDPDMPFITGGTMICRINQDQQGAARYSPVFVIPSAWVSFVSPALESYKSHRAIFMGEPASPTPAAPVAVGVKLSTQQRDQLAKLTTDPNPFLAQQAVRLLATSGDLDATALARQIQEARGLRQALLTYLLLRFATDKARSVAVSGLNTWVAAATSANQITGVALGLFTAKQSRMNGFYNDDMDLLRTQLDKKRTEFGGGAEATATSPPVQNLTDGMSNEAADRYLSAVLSL